MACTELPQDLVGSQDILPVIGHSGDKKRLRHYSSEDSSLAIPSSPAPQMTGTTQYDF